MAIQDRLLFDPALPVNGDALPYGEVTAQNRMLSDQLVDADISHAPIGELMARRAELQAANPGAFRLLSNAAIHDTF